MEKQFSYTTLLDIKYDHLELIDVPGMVAACKDKWFNQTLTQVNCSVVRLGWDGWRLVESGAFLFRLQTICPISDGPGLRKSFN